MRPRVLVSIVSYNSVQFLSECLESLKVQTYPNCVASLWDNASTDGSVDVAAAQGDFLHHLHVSSRNIGFCAAHNRIIDANSSDYVLVLNPDVILDPHFIEILVHALEQDHRAGSATGKLWRWPPDRPFSASSRSLFSKPGKAKTIDSTGIFLTPNQRHLDRGSGESDVGQYETSEYVFGATGAAALYRRSMLEEVTAANQFFDEDFFAYREDADLAWRAQWMGWRCAYIPAAKGFHVRRVLPERRAHISAEINMHSFKNRFLLRIKNLDAGTYLRFLFPITSRDLLALGYVLLRERSSLRAFPLLLRAAPRAWSVRRALQRHRRVSPGKMRSWFSYRPVSKPRQ